MKYVREVTLIEHDGNSKPNGKAYAMSLEAYISSGDLEFPVSNNRSGHHIQMKSHKTVRVSLPPVP
jgi:hypothetical protein